ncbi:MAG TPA: hypothetical protein VJ810_21700 [Blastocatellia bacterium]|nr:hypothetical protein [Blastocatellia bacterium]
MLQADAVQFDFSFYQPTLGEFVSVVSLWWLIGLTLIVVGAYGLNRSKTRWVELLALVTLMLGFGVCILLGWSFTPINRHRLYVWTDDRSINYWTDICLALMIWGTSLLVYGVGGKIGKRGVKRREQNAN